MRDIFFHELRECNRNIKKIENDVERKQGYDLLCKTIEKMCELTGIARHEGLLVLEEAAFDLGDLHNKEFLSYMILLIVDGTDPKLVEELGMAKYFATGVECFDALQYLIMLTGSLAIQDGENSRVIEEKLFSLVPMEVVNEYKQKKEEAFFKAESVTEYGEDFLEKYYQGDIAVELGDEYYFQLKIIDYALCSLDDRSTQRLLRDVSNMDLALALIGLSGEARRKVFQNLSENLAIMIAEDMKIMGNIELRDSAAASLKIFNILLRLVRTAEIVCEDAEVMVTFGKIFDITADIKYEGQIRKEESELMRIMREYNAASHKTIKFTWSEE